MILRCQKYDGFVKNSKPSKFKHFIIQRAKSESRWPISSLRFWAVICEVVLMHLFGWQGWVQDLINLCCVYLPNSKQKTLHQTKLVQRILNFEILMGQYESSIGNTYSGVWRQQLFWGAVPTPFGNIHSFLVKIQALQISGQKVCLLGRSMHKFKFLLLNMIHQDLWKLFESERWQGAEGQLKGKGRGGFGRMAWGFARGKGKEKPQKKI